MEDGKDKQRRRQRFGVLLQNRMVRCGLGAKDEECSAIERLKFGELHTQMRGTAGRCANGRRRRYVSCVVFVYIGSVGTVSYE